MDGYFKAVNARTGDQLWQFKLPSGIIGQPVTFTGPDKKQYVAILSAVGGWAGVRWSRVTSTLATAQTPWGS
jgi:alcohol dehydrogenase (cytochrome c)